MPPAPKAVAEQCEVIITILPNSPHVKEVVLGENGVIDGAKAGGVVIDMTSIAPLASREIAAALAEKHIHMLDAPVSGGEPKAIDGTLSVMVGGDKGIFERHAAMLESMAGSVVHTGDIGAGNVTKLANQVIVALNIAAMSEALVLATKAGGEHRAGRQSADGIGAQFQTRFSYRLAYQGFGQCAGYLPRRGRAAAADCRGHGNDAGAETRRFG